MMKLTFIMLNKPGMLKQMLKQMPEVDQLVFREPESSKAIIDATKEAFLGEVFRHFKNSVNPPPWGFKLEDITYPITIWQGGMDKQAPEMHARIYAKLIPNANLTFLKMRAFIDTQKSW